MFLKLLVAMILMIVCATGVMSPRFVKNKLEARNINTMSVVLDKAIVDYYRSHGGNFPKADAGCVSVAALKSMGLSSYSYYRDSSKFSYSVNGDGTFSLTINPGDGSSSYTTANSNKAITSSERLNY